MSTNEHLPKAIRAQLEQVEALEASMQAPAPEPAPAPAPAIQEPTPAAETQVGTSAPAPAPATDTAELDKWRQKASTLDGMLRHDMPRLRDQVSQQNQTIRDLERRLSDATAALEKRANEANDLGKKDIEAFGSELIEMVQRQSEGIVRQAVSRQLTDVLNRLGALEGALTGVSKDVAVSAEKLFYRALDSGVPNWREVNSDPRFHAWLADADPVYGVARQAALDQAQQAWNGEQAVNVFKAFIATLPAPREPARELQQQVVPSRTGGEPAVAAQPAVEIVSASDVEKFYNDLRRGRYVGREAEAATLEAKFDKALSEGRMR